MLAFLEPTPSRPRRLPLQARSQRRVAHVLDTAARLIDRGGPEAVTWHDVIAAHERVQGRQIEVRYLPSGGVLPGLPDFVSGFMNLLETYDTVIQMDSLAQEFGVRQVTVDESIERQLAAAATA